MSFDRERARRRSERRSLDLCRAPSPAPKRHNERLRDPNLSPVRNSANTRRRREPSAPPVSLQTKFAPGFFATGSDGPHFSSEPEGNEAMNRLETTSRPRSRPQELYAGEVTIPRRPARTSAVSLGNPVGQALNRLSVSIDNGSPPTRDDNRWKSATLNDIEPIRSKRNRRSATKPTPVAEDAIAPGDYDNFHTPLNKGFYRRFRYRPLERERQEIRLLRIDNTSHDHYVMVGPVSLGNPPPYCAISYVAGDPLKTTKIFVNDVEFNAFENLGNALDDVRKFWKTFRPKQELLLWVDQLCINQSDHSERSHQVGYMKEIYRNAGHVIIPLRCHTDPQAPLVDETNRLREFAYWTTQLAPRLERWGFEWLDHTLKAHQLSLALTKGRTRDIFKPTKRNRANARRVLTGIIEALEGGWAVIGSILAHPWWRRAWVYQEFLVGSRTSFYVSIGGEGVSLRWEALYDLLRSCIIEYAGRSSEYINYVVNSLHGSKGWDAEANWKKRFKLREAHERHMNHIHAHWPTVRSTFESKERWDGETQLSDTLRHARNFQSSDRRDKVYAFLGLASPDYNIVPNYNPERSALSVFIETTERIIQKEGNLGVLEDAINNDRLQSDNPSWVPDWASPIPAGHLNLWTGISMPGDCSAAGPEPAAFGFYDHRSRTSTMRVLEVRGVFVGFLNRVIQDEYKRSWRWHSCKPHPDVGIPAINVATTSTAQSGDEIWIIHGMNYPLSLRRNGPFRCLLGPAMLREPATPPEQGPVSSIMYGSLCLPNSSCYPELLSLI